MKTIWDLLRYMKKSKRVGIHNAKVVIRETENGNEYELTDIGITEYFCKRGNIEFELNGVNHQRQACYVTLNVYDKHLLKRTIGCALEYEKHPGDENVFARAVKKGVINGMRSLLKPEVKQELIKKYLQQGSFIRIPLETEKIKLFRPKLKTCFSGRVG